MIYQSVMFSILIRNSLLIFVLYNAGESKVFEIKPKPMECKIFKADIISNLTCTYKPLSWKRGKYNVDVYIKKGIEINNFMIKGSVYRRESNMEYRVFGPKEVTMDTCKFLNGSWTHIAVELIAAYMKLHAKSNNFFHPCPFSGHVYIRDMIVDENAYSAANFLPDGVYMFKAKVFTNRNNKEHLLMETKTHVDLVPVGINSKK